VRSGVGILGRGGKGNLQYYKDRKDCSANEFEKWLWVFLRKIGNTEI